MIQIRYVDKNIKVEKKDCVTCKHRSYCELLFKIDDIDKVKEYFNCECSQYDIYYPTKIVDIDDEDIEGKIMSLIKDLPVTVEKFEDY